jgi:hypothetical protein
MSNSSRISSIDFWRGGVLIAILVDHIPGNVLESLTPRNFGFSDGTEAFVFLFGLSVGLVYVPRARNHGFEAVARGCLQRALKLYGVHIGLTIAALAIFAAGHRMSGAADLIQAHGRSFVFDSPATGVAGLALLSHQLGYFNILPLYVVLMLWAPLALAVSLHDPRLALVVSAGIYAASRALGLHLPNWPEPGSWFFNPFAWQLVFTLGLTSAILWRDRPPRPAPGLVTASAAIVVAAALVVTGAGGLAPGLRDTASAHLDLAKQDLGLARLAHFLALAYIAAVAPGLIPGLTRLVEGAAGRAIQSLGRHSLAIFAGGSLVSAGGQAALAAASPHAGPAVVHCLGIAYTLAGVAALFILAHWIECRNPPIRIAFPSHASQPV